MESKKSVIFMLSDRSHVRCLEDEWTEEINGTEFYKSHVHVIQNKNGSMILIPHHAIIKIMLFPQEEK